MADDIEYLTSENTVAEDSNDTVDLGVTFKLEAFEGPLDLLLSLIKKDKIQITDIFVSDITDQYLSYMEQIDNVDLDKGTDFLLMAAYLIEIKARDLLPKDKPEEEEEDDPKKELIKKLEEYALYKEESAKLKEKETVDSWFRTPDSSLADETVVLKDMTLEGILHALKKIEARAIKRKAEIKNTEIPRDPFTVEEKIILIKDLLDQFASIHFEQLFEGDTTKNEIITTFQAMLELMKVQYIKVEQTEIFGDIQVYKIAEDS